MTPRLSVVILAYNEAQNLAGVCEEILDTVRGLAVSSEVIIVDDGSRDATGRVADELAGREPSVRVIHHPVNLGLGGGYRTGFEKARGEFLTFFPADGQFHATVIPQFLAMMEQADMVLGYIPDRDSSILVKGLSFIERALYRVAFGRMPRFQGIFMIRRAILADTTLVSTGRGWAVVMELIIRTSRGPYRVRGLPNEMRPRMSGESKVNNVRTIVANLRQLFELYGRL